MHDGSVADLNARIAAIRARDAGCQPELVADLVRAILEAVRADARTREATILELVDLDQAIAPTWVDLARPKPAGASPCDAAFATDQLEATLAHTAAATDRILDVCEMLDRVAGELGNLRGRRNREASVQLGDATRRIYEACGFQDITGQRITKVADAIKGLETRIAQIVSALGSAGVGFEANWTRVEVDPRPLAGPSLPTTMTKQSEVDHILASFG